MQGKNWIRIALCGWVVGVVYFLLATLSIPFMAQDFLTLVEEGGPHSPWGGGVSFGIDLMMGIWTMWLYSAIAPRYGAGAKTAAIAGVAWWAMKSLQSAKWAGLGFLPLTVGAVLVPLAITVIYMMVAAGIGAWLYEKVEMPTASNPSPQV